MLLFLQSLKIGAFTCICFIINSDDDGDYIGPLFPSDGQTNGRTRLICNDALNNVKANYVNKKNNLNNVKSSNFLTDYCKISFVENITESFFVICKKAPNVYFAYKTCIE